MENNTNLKFFYGEGCKFTAKAMPEIDCVEQFINRKIQKFEVWSNDDNMVEYKRSEGTQNCGGVPYFYNASTGSSVCGAQKCDILKEWAMSTSKINR
jgi:hypothetical protein